MGECNFFAVGFIKKNALFGKERVRLSAVSSHLIKRLIKTRKGGAISALPRCCCKGVVLEVLFPSFRS